MNPFKRVASCAVLGLALTANAGCSDNIALIGRPALQLDQEEIFAEIDRVDLSSRQMHLRPENSHSRVVGYSADVRVLYQGREYSIDQLEKGDKVSMQLKQDSRGDSYTNLIRVQESVRDRNQSGHDTSRAMSGLQAVDGRVEQIDFQRKSFEMRDEARARIVVSLPENAHTSDIDHFNALRSGDYVRVEGRFLDRQRFELEGFLRDNR